MKTIRARITNIFADGNLSLDTGKRVDGKIVFTTVNRKDFYRFGVQVPAENDVLDFTVEKHGRKQFPMKDASGQPVLDSNNKPVMTVSKNYRFAGITSISPVKDSYDGLVEDEPAEDVPFQKENKKPAPRKRATKKKAPVKKES